MKNSSKSSTAKLLGSAFETSAAKFLQQKGLHILAKNYHSRYGEIDLIAKDDEFLVFVEVRYRKKNSLVTAAESIDLRKQEKIAKSALDYLQKFYSDNFPACRFDVIVGDGEEIEWIKSAFLIG